MSQNMLAGPLALGLVVMGGLLLAQASPSNLEPRERELTESLPRISLQVSALQTLHCLKATPDQLEALSRLARAITPRPRDRQVGAAGDKYRKALTDLRKALVEGSEERVADMTEGLRDLLEDGPPDLDDGVEIVPVARQKTAEVLRLFNARQLAGYLGSLGDEFPDPLERLLAGVEEARTAKAEEWGKQRQTLAELTGWLVAGLHHKNREKAEKTAGELLDQAHDLTDEDYKTKKPELEKAAREVVGDVAPTDVLRHYLQHDLAELLSNPELPTVLETRLKQIKKSNHETHD